MIVQPKQRGSHCMHEIAAATWASAPLCGCGLKFPCLVVRRRAGVGEIPHKCSRACCLCAPGTGLVTEYCDVPIGLQHVNYISTTTIVKVPRFCAWIGLRLVSYRAPGIGRPVGLLGTVRLAQNSKPTPVWAANTRHEVSDLCSAATLGMRMPCLDTCTTSGTCMLTHTCTGCTAHQIVIRPMLYAWSIGCGGCAPPLHCRQRLCGHMHSDAIPAALTTMHVHGTKCACVPDPQHGSPVRMAP